MNYCQIGRSAENSIKLFRPRDKEENGTQVKGGGGRDNAQLWYRIELSALNSAFYARDRALAYPVSTAGWRHYKC